MDNDLLGDLIDINSGDIELLDEICINEVYSNSFFFITRKNLQIINGEQLYMVKNKSSGDVIYFRVNTVKNKDSLYFFQHINWVTSKNRKIEKGTYSLNKINNQ
ncbi:hypothetical protein HCG49_09760 [Arenibacter sp. 6A1]|uniref:hypothetical protein n=1 Tax=Arenibacter sp. 6A1 TaxID=2720391 RepID=UPI001445D789|nr:hypothetical protein [Arenibacter sp. 6A1]NKI26848.1 hypothetical protein [Arenibacter sp. 6A1]